MLRNRSGQFVYFTLVSSLSGNAVTGSSGSISGRKSLDGLSGMIVLSGNIIELGGGSYRANLYDLFSYILLLGNRHGFLGCPSVSDSGVCRWPVDFIQPTPFTQGECPFFDGNSYVVAFISSLLYWSRPFAIFWAVSLVIVFSVQTVILRGGFSHVFQESDKGFSPTGAYLYSSATVVCVTRIFRSVTTIQHRSPCQPYLGTTLSVGGLKSCGHSVDSGEAFLVTSA